MAKARNIFTSFFQSERSGGFVLIGCTLISLIIANSAGGGGYLNFWHSHLDLSVGGILLDYSVEQWVNDGLMAVFFLMIGLEIERELYVGELSDLKNALLPIAAAIGGMVVPALIHILFNSGTPTHRGFGIPMATDIAFALGILSLAGKRVPVSLKIFLTALAIIDDLGAIAIIAIFYTSDFSVTWFLIALAIFAALFFLGKRRVFFLPLYLAGGIVMWYCMLKSGVHATIAGVLLAFAIPYPRTGGRNPSVSLQHGLHYPVAFIILPIFALANTAILLPKDLIKELTTPNSLGILLGLIVGKVTGIFLAAYLAVKVKLASLAPGLNWRWILGAALLGGIGFTMSIFISILAFPGNTDLINESKISILTASLISAILGILVLKRNGRRAGKQDRSA
ncbi:MAG: Na+/H+ antiporter NhaA [Chitinophagaceae bacterium]